jgi:hypothetical protein
MDYYMCLMFTFLVINTALLIGVLNGIEKAIRAGIFVRLDKNTTDALERIAKVLEDEHEGN